MTASFQRTLRADDEVLVAGAGPAGLATAMMLSQQGFRNVVVAEQREGSSEEDPQRSYSYSIDVRSQRLLQKLGLMHHLPSIGLATGDMKVHTVSPNGRVQQRSMAMKDQSIVNYWMPRTSFLQLLTRELLQCHSNSVRLLFNTSLQSIELDGGRSQSPVRATLRHQSSGDTEHIEPALLVGADGIKSRVRGALSEWDGGSKFHMHQVDSPSAGLKFKVLSVSPELPLGRDNNDHADVTEAIIYQPQVRDKNRRVRLGSLPQKDSGRSRSINVINFPSHSIWSARDAESVYSILEENLPQLDVRSLISREEVERFAKREEGAFPAPQCPEQLTATIRSARNGSSTSPQSLESSGDPTSVAGVLLVGDACHCFPPDLGQGVNSALEDVHELWNAIESNNGNIDGALKMYEEQRLPNVYALIQLQQFSAPYQYNLEPLKNKAWGINLLMRTQLSKLAPFMFDNASFMLVQQGLPYSEILRRSHNTTRNIAATATAGGIALASALLSSIS